MTTQQTLETLELPVAGMGAGCTKSVQQALTALPGVHSAEVLLSSEKAIIRLDPTAVDRPALTRAVEGAGYRVPAPIAADQSDATQAGERGFTRAIFGLLGIVFGAVLFIVVVGEWLFSGTDTGGVAGTPTGKRFEVRGATIFELQDGKASRNTDYYNASTVLEQLGLLPVPEATPSP
jgi:cation transport ATPase